MQQFSSQFTLNENNQDWASYLLRNRRPELFVQFNNYTQTNQHIFLTFNLRKKQTILITIVSFKK